MRTPKILRRGLAAKSFSKGRPPTRRDIYDYENPSLKSPEFT